MVNSSTLESAGLLLVYFILGVVVYFLSRIMKIEYKGFELSHPKQSALYALGAVIISSCMITGLMLSISAQNASESDLTTTSYTLSKVINIMISWLIMLSPVFIMKRIRKETWRSCGVSKHNLKQSLWIGTILAVLIIVIVLLFGLNNLADVGQKLTISAFWALLYYAVAGFSEEFMFRGFLQVRLIEWIGKWQGWILTSILMAFIHIPQRMALGLSPLEALISSAYLIPISLIMGYIMIKTENIVAPGICHTFANWVNVIM
jgi:membrane protease YdiL (CAAX protease family)